VDRAGLMAGLMMFAILLTLWVAVRSVKIIAAILLTLFAGWRSPPRSPSSRSAPFNVISVAFIPLFVGIGVDFGIQYTGALSRRAPRVGRLERALTQRQEHGAVLVIGSSGDGGLFLFVCAEGLFRASPSSA